VCVHREFFEKQFPFTILWLWKIKYIFKEMQFEPIEHILKDIYYHSKGSN
jgi:hypothetical protein